jgi:hypothetical protein
LYIIIYYIYRTKKKIKAEKKKYLKRLNPSRIVIKKKKEKMRQKILFVCFLTLVSLLMVASLSSATMFDWLTGRLTQQNTDLTITISGNSPVVETITSIPSQSITETGETNVTFFANISDPDGLTNLATVNATFNLTGQAIRENATCVNVTAFNSTKGNYSCTIRLWYWDQGGDWNVTVKVKDIDNNVGSRVGTFVLGSTSALLITPTSLSWASASPGAVNRTPTNNPLLMNNTGNTNITAGNVQVRAYDLIGTPTTGYSIQAANFSVAPYTGSFNECNTSATTMVNASYQAITGSVLNVGNNTNSQGQANLYYCLRQVPSSIISQQYNSAGLGAWTIKIA